MWEEDEMHCKGFGTFLDRGKKAGRRDTDERHIIEDVSRTKQRCVPPYINASPHWRLMEPHHRKYRDERTRTEVWLRRVIDRTKAVYKSTRPDPRS